MLKRIKPCSLEVWVTDGSCDLNCFFLLFFSVFVFRGDHHLHTSSSIYIVFHAWIICVGEMPSKYNDELEENNVKLPKLLTLRDPFNILHRSGLSTKSTLNSD